MTLGPKGLPSNSCKQLTLGTKIVFFFNGQIEVLCACATRSSPLHDHDMRACTPALSFATLVPRCRQVKDLRVIPRHGVLWRCVSTITGPGICVARFSLGIMTTSQSANKFSLLQRLKTRRHVALLVVRDQVHLPSTARLRQWYAMFQFSSLVHTARSRKRCRCLPRTAGIDDNRLLQHYRYASCNCPPQGRVHDGAQHESTPQTQIASTEKDSTIS